MLRCGLQIAFQQFQPTPPAQGATINCKNGTYDLDFNPRPPHRGRRQAAGSSMGTV